MTRVTRLKEAFFWRPGSRVDCIIGSACIRDFSTATEVLQGKAGHFGSGLVGGASGCGMINVSVSISDLGSIHVHTLDSLRIPRDYSHASRALHP